MDATKMSALEAMVSEVDGNSPAGQAEQAQQIAAEQQQQTEAQAWAAVPFALGQVLCMFAPELQAIYTKEACDHWGANMVPVAEKYGWTGPSKLPELGLLVATGTLALPTWLIVRAKLQAIREAQRLAEAQQQAAAAGAPAVVDMSPVPTGEAPSDGG